jgi:aminoglycoside phosphotransferase (APT) family kinase protein
MMRAAQKLGAVVPDVVGFSLSPEGASDFLVMRHVEGASPSLWEVPKWIEASGDGTRLKIARSVINALRPLRTYPSSSVVNLADSYRAYLCEVELKLRDAAKDVFALPPSVKKVLDWLIERCAELSSSPALYHGDFRLGNIVFKDGNVAALLDWERAMPGHYLHDVGYFSLPAMRTGDLLCGVATQEELVVIWKEEFGEPLDIRLCAFFRAMSMFTEFCVMVRALARLAQAHGRMVGARTLPLVARLHFDMLVAIREWDNGQFHL